MSLYLPAGSQNTVDDLQQRSSTHSIPPIEQSTSLHSSGASPRPRRRRRSGGDHSQNQSSPVNKSRDAAGSVASSVFDLLSYTDVDTGQREEFQFLIARETGWRRVCCHKGLVANVIFILLMAAGIVLGEILFPLEGFHGSGRAIFNDTVCLQHIEGCVSVRILRAIGLFGFVGGITNWIAIEMLLVRIPYLIGTGVIAKKYKEIRGGIRHIIIHTLFDPSAVSEYFSGQRKYAIEMLHLGHQFGSLLESDAAGVIIEQKIDSVLSGPQGLVLSLLGVDHTELRSIIRKNVQLFLADISPIVLDKLSLGIVTGDGLQEEVEQILEQKIEELSATKVKQIITVIIRKHLSWLILWGNVSGALIGLISELATLLVAYLIGDITPTN